MSNEGENALLGFIRRHIDLAKAKLHWKQTNAHNGTWLENAPVGMDNISIGRYTYGPIEISTSLEKPTLRIGCFCSVATGVKFLTGNEHPLNRVSTYPFSVKLLGQTTSEALSKGGIVVGDDVWIGVDALILDGVTIGQGAVIGARAGDPPVIDLGGPERYLGPLDPAPRPAPLGQAAPGPAGRPPAVESLLDGELLAQRAPTLHVEQPVDRLVAHPHLFVVREVRAQAQANLPGGPRPRESRDHVRPQPRARLELTPSGLCSVKPF